MNFNFESTCEKTCHRAGTWLKLFEILLKGTVEVLKGGQELAINYGP